MSDKAMALGYLRKSLNSPKANFKPGQWESIEQLLANRRLLIVQSTGWGKSMVYFLTTKLLRDRGKGLTLLISPLLSLMRNQLAAAERIGICAKTINSNNKDAWKTISNDLMEDRIDVLLISPERLSSDEFQSTLQNSRIGMLVIDEAHCISDWGHDFRPDYRRIVRIVNALPPNIPLLATTATANTRVVNDIKAQLGKDLLVQRGSLLRTSLHLQNIVIPSKAGRLAWLASTIPSLPQSGIIYTLTVRDAELVSQWLQRKGIIAKTYSANLTSELRETLETELIENKIKVLVATVALGMGFDKPDLGFVIHFQRPASVVHYYQQVGRAGRAIASAHGILLCGSEDDIIAEYFIKNAFPPQSYINDIINILKDAEDGLSLPEIEKHLNLPHNKIKNTLKFLEIESPSPITNIGKRWYATAEAYRYHVDTEYINKIIALRHDEQIQMQEYMRYKGCLMLFLQNALNDDSDTHCGKCQNCAPADALPETYPNALALEAKNFLLRNYQVIVPKKQWPSRKNIPEDLRAECGWALCLWKDGGWGDKIAECKYHVGQFSDVLVQAFITMLKDSFPNLPFDWVTCVPSLRDRTLVPDFAKRIAARLNRPFIPCVIKTHETEPQKTMLNSSQQVNNIEHVFLVTRPCSGRCLLIDDIVNSGWTLTIISQLLRKAGCTAVYPSALAILR